MDFFDSVGGLGLGSRLKRLSDLCMSEVKQVYSLAGVEFEPRWFPLFSMLVKHEKLTVVSAAQELGITHPHVSQIAKELTQAKLATFQANPLDRRSRVLKLTKKGHATASRMQPIWSQIGSAMAEIIQISDPKFLSSLERLEQALQKRSLAALVRERTKQSIRKRSKIRNYSHRYRGDFEKLNREWLQKYFSIEPVDLKYFANPVQQIIAKGGDIFFVELDGKIVGTCSLLLEGGNLELAKMAVTESARGQGIGEILLLEAIKRANRLKAKKLLLVTNTKLKPAIRLYEKLGFVTIFQGQHPKYKRGNLLMEKSLRIRK